MNDSGNWKRITLITTGGTIAMRRDEETGNLSPALSGEDLLRAIPEIADKVSLTVREFSNIPSEYMTPAMMLRLSRVIDMEAAEADGIVVTHGTDTLEETAYFLSLVLRTTKPVVLTGAMRDAEAPDADGPANLALAIRVACEEKAKVRGVLATMHGKIWSARNVSKRHANRVDAFDTADGTPEAIETDAGISWNQTETEISGIKNKEKLSPRHMESRVWIVTCAAGTEEDILRCALTEKVDGVVIEALGCGNVPEPVAAGIQKLTAADIPVIITTRIGAGQVEKEYAGKGGAAALEAAGAILAGSLSGHKARLLLMAAIGSGKTLPEISDIFRKEA